ncbi:hypothetical protein ROZALSC1DRAFT_8154, partial [Rozella allomycis CSF55]
IEIEVKVNSSLKQKKMYQSLKNKMSLKDLINKSNDDSYLMNLVMQFRKVCNHPDLFEKSNIVSPFIFSRNVPIESNCLFQNENPIQF